MKKICYRFSLCEMHLPDVPNIRFHFKSALFAVFDNIWDTVVQNDDDRKSIMEAINDLTLRQQNMIIHQFNRIH